MRLAGRAARRRGRAGRALTALLAAGGSLCVAVALTSQQHPAQPVLSARQALGPPAPGLVWSRARAASTASEVGGPVLPRSEPVALSIPKIGVHSALLHLGLTPEGSVEVPQPGPHYDEAAWYRYSPTPGSLGPAVIVGHVDSVAAGPSVFFRLGSLQPQDAIVVSRADGTVARFVVDAVRRYPKARFPTQLVYGDTTQASLRLITCGGPFDRRNGHYLDNVVVFASLVGNT